MKHATRSNPVFTKLQFGKELLQRHSKRFIPLRPFMKLVLQYMYSKYLKTYPSSVKYIE